MCEYKHEYSFCFEENAHENENASSWRWDCEFENLWQQISEELRREQENDELYQMFQEKLTLDCRQLS